MTLSKRSLTWKIFAMLISFQMWFRSENTGRNSLKTLINIEDNSIFNSQFSI